MYQIHWITFILISGDIVGIFYSKSQNTQDGTQVETHGNSSNQGELASGVVNLAKPNAIHISFEDSFDELLTKLSDDDLYNIIKLANDVTYKRLRVVLDRIKESIRLSQ